MKMKQNEQRNVHQLLSNLTRTVYITICFFFLFIQQCVLMGLMDIHWRLIYCATLSNVAFQ